MFICMYIFVDIYMYIVYNTYINKNIENKNTAVQGSCRSQAPSR